MARPIKHGIDYFPHDTTSGKTLFTLESKYGNDGYAFWFKLLEILGTQEGLSFNCGNPADWLYLVAKTHVSEETATEILDLLASLDAIDAELWQHKIIWVQNFVDRLSDVYNKRATEIPQKPSFRDENPVKESFRDENPTKTGVSAEISTQSKVKKRKVKESKENNKSAPEKDLYGETVKLSKKEYEALHEKYGDDGVKWIIEKLDNYKVASGRKYASDYGAISSWVKGEYEKEHKSRYIRAPEEYQFLEAGNGLGNTARLGETFKRRRETQKSTDGRVGRRRVLPPAKRAKRAGATGILRAGQVESIGLYAW